MADGISRCRIQNIQTLFRIIPPREKSGQEIYISTTKWKKMSSSSTPCLCPRWH